MEDKKNYLIIRYETAISPYSPQKQLLIDSRQRIVQLLRQTPSIVKSAKNLTEGTIYQAHINPKVLQRLKEGTARFGTRDNGLLSANILDSKTGKIVHNVSLKEIHPEFLDSLNQLSVQQTLANIVQRLETIDEKITDVLQGQQNDRLAEIQSGIDIFEQAIAATDLETQRGLLINAIQNLNDGRNKLLMSTDVYFIDELPRSKIKMLLSPKWDIPKFVQRKAEPVGKAGHAIVRASRYIILAYAILEEPVSLQVSLQQSEEKIAVFEDKVKQIVHWLPPDNPWRESMLQFSDGALLTNQQLQALQHKVIVIEFLPEEITASHPPTPDIYIRQNKPDLTLNRQVKRPKDVKMS